MKQICLLLFAFNFSVLLAWNPKNSTHSALNSVGFEKNLGQVSGKDKQRVEYFFKSGHLTVFLTKTGLVYQFEKWHKEGDLKENPGSWRKETYRMDLEFTANNKIQKIVEENPTDQLTHYYNYGLIGVNAYKKITYKNVYPNIDWVIYTDYKEANKNIQSKSQEEHPVLKYDFIVHPGGNPNAIKLKLKWVEQVNLNEDGSIEFLNSLGTISERKPYSFQSYGDKSTEIASSFVLKNDELSFLVGTYDTSRPLIIDPILQWATYYGGSSSESGGYTTIDTSGFVYLSGTTASSATIAAGGHQTTIGGSNDAFLVKFNSSGIRQWASYYVGSDDDRGTYCHVDKNNNVYLAGRTMSTSGVASGGHQTTHGGDFDAFVVKFNAAGTRQWATYYGGSNIEEHVTCATDTGLNVYLAGTTQSNNNIFATGGVQNTFGGFSDAFLVKFNASGARQWGTFYGGTLLEEAGQCAVDKTGSVYLCGTTRSTTNIASGGFQNTKNNVRDGFLVKFNSNGTRAWGTYYGGDQDDYGNSVCVDTQLNVYIAGFTYSSSGIASGGFQNSFGGSNDAYLAKFNTSGARLWATYYGGSNGDYGPHCITDKYNNVYLTGYTLSSNNIAFAGIKNVFGGNIEGFVVKFNPTGFRFWGTYYGGSNDDYLLSSAPDGFGNIYYSGNTLSNALISSGGHQNTYGGAGDVFLVKMSEDPIPYIEIFSNKGDTICQGDSIVFTKNDVNGGSAPKYRWFVNNVQVDTTASFKYGGFSTGDSVKCLLISNAVGLLFDSAWSLPIKFFVHPKKYTTLNVSICRPQSYFFKGQSRSASGTVIDTLSSSKGCDSIITLNLTIKDTSSYQFFDTICSNQSYFFNGLGRTASGVYKDTLVSASNCDSFLYLNLFVKSISQKTIDTTICPKNPYLFNGVWRSTSGTYLDTLVNSKGCDSFLTLNLTVKSNSTKVIDTAICSGFSYWFKGQNRTSAGTYRDTLINSVGCDSFITLNLTIKALSFTNLNATICDDQSYIFKGIPRTVAGVYKDTLINAVGCDSIITLNLTVNTRSYKTIADTICSNEFFFFNGNNLNITGTYLDTLVNSKNCDSFITLNLQVLPVSNTTLNQTICANSSYFFNGFNRTIAGTYLDTLLNSKGCDSFITLNLNVSSTSSFTYSQEICLGDSILFNGVYRKSSGSFKDTLLNALNCDSFVNLNLVVNNPTSYSYSISRCKNNPLYFNNQFLNITGIYKDTLVNQYGCDSFITLNYTSRDTSSYSYSASICQGESFVFNGTPRTTSGLYTFTTINSQGCDSIISLNLTVRPVYSKIIDTSICNGNSVFFKGSFISAPGVYIDSYKTIHNCDSLIILDLKNYPPTYNTLYRKFCKNGGVWFNGNFLTSSGIYKDTLINKRGCDSFLTLVLSQDTAHINYVTYSICAYDSLQFNGQYIRTAGLYIDTLKNLGGCDSTVHLTLIVHTPKPITLSKYNPVVLISELGFKTYQWYVNGALSPLEKRHYLEVKTTGNYKVIGIDSNNCLSTSNDLYMTYSSIESSRFESLKIYPNPIKDKVFIDLPSSFNANSYWISLYNMEGKRVLDANIQREKNLLELQLENMPNGNYILELRTKEKAFSHSITIEN